MRSICIVPAKPLLGVQGDNPDWLDVSSHGNRPPIWAHRSVYCPGTARRPHVKSGTEHWAGYFNSLQPLPFLPRIKPLGRLVVSHSAFFCVSPLAVMFFSSTAFLLAAAAAVQATIYDVQVGDSSGALTFTPDAIVNLLSFLGCRQMLTGMLRSLQTPETRSFSTSSKRTTARPSRRSPPHVPPYPEASILACKYPHRLLSSQSLTTSPSNPVPANQTDNFPTHTITVNDVSAAVLADDFFAHAGAS